MFWKRRLTTRMICKFLDYFNDIYELSNEVLHLRISTSHRWVAGNPNKTKIQLLLSDI